MMNQEQIKAALQLALGSGGPLVALLLSYGLPADKLSLWTNVIVAFVPPIAAGVWAIIERKHKNQIAAVAAIPGVEKVKISPAASGGALQAAADDNLPNVTMKSPAWISILLLLFLAACASQEDRSSLQGRLETVRTAYLVAGLTVATYSALPPCSAKITVGCSNPDVVAKAGTAVAAVGLAIDGAEAALKTESSDVSSREKAVQIAQAALVALTRVLTEYRIARGQG